MSNTYKNFSPFALAGHEEAFRALLEVFHHFSIRYFLIGAQARDVHFFQQGIKPPRITLDIDFAVMVVSMGQYQALIEMLQAKGFEKSKEPHRLNWAKSSTIIDLLPFGQIAEDFTVNFDEKDTELSVLGYNELIEETEEFYLNEDYSISIPVPPLHGLFILKLLSWDDQKPDRDKDLTDLKYILDHYWEFAEEEAYEKHHDLFTDNFEASRAAARILGRHLRITLDKSNILRDKVLRILKEQSSAVEPPGLMLRRFSSNNNQSITEVKALLDAVILGVNDK